MRSNYRNAAAASPTDRHRVTYNVPRSLRRWRCHKQTHKTHTRALIKRACVCACVVSPTSDAFTHTHARTDRIFNTMCCELCNQTRRWTDRSNRDTHTMTMVSRTTNCWPLLVADASAAATAADAAAVAVAAAVDAAADVGWCWWWWLSRSPPVGSLWYLELKSPPLLGFIMVVARSQSPAPVHTRISTRWVGGGWG